MKRIGFFFDKVCDFRHLFDAFKKALKGSGKSRQAQAFNFYAEKEIINLKHELEAGTYVPKPYRYFKVHDPKERIISVAPFRDRVVHHAVVSAMEPVYERCFIFDSYATRKCKGTHPALNRAQQFLRKNSFYLKMDILKYFYNIDQGILIQLIKRKIKDKQFLNLVEKIIKTGDKGLPIGNLTSQFFANVYLNPLDHFIKETLKAKYYIRYMDDFVVFSSTIYDLKNCHEKIEAFLKEYLNLELKKRATVLNTKNHGLSFLGFRIFPDLKRIKSSSLRRIHRNIQMTQMNFDREAISEKMYALKMNSYFNHIGFADSSQLRSDLIKGCSQ